MATLQELIAQKESLDKLIQETRKTELADAVGKVKALIAEYGLTQEDVFGTSRGAKKVLRTDLISTQGLKLFEAEFGAASRSDFGGAHAGQIVGRA